MLWGKTAGQTGGCRPVPDTGAVFTGEGAVAKFGTRGIPVVSPTNKEASPNVHPLQ